MLEGVPVGEVVRLGRALRLAETARQPVHEDQEYALPHGYALRDDGKGLTVVQLRTGSHIWIWRGSPMTVPEAVECLERMHANG